MQSRPVTTRSDSPCPKREALQLQHSWFDEEYEADCTDQHAEDVGGVVPVVNDVAGATAVDTTVFLGLEGT